MQQITVNLAERSYLIDIVPNGLHNTSLLTHGITSNTVGIITNTTVAPLYLANVETRLQQAGKRVISIILPDGEAYKHWESIETIINTLLENKCGRKTTLVALGGGVIGDMTGFAAAIYMRGIPFVQIPTTLLSQVDSSVGGKTGINAPLGKNMIGAFYQPQHVLIDPLTLNTLPDRELSAGLAEIIKHGLIQDKSYAEYILTNMQALRERHAETLAHTIATSVKIKANVVASDETETGIRAILNFGHTFGHAIEAGLGYGSWLHGEAVGAGMILAAELSKRCGHITQTEVDWIKDCVNKAGLPVNAPNLGINNYMDLMRVDKKANDGEIQFVLLKQIGEAMLAKVNDHFVLETLNQTTI